MNIHHYTFLFLEWDQEESYRIQEALKWEFNVTAVLCKTAEDALFEAEKREGEIASFFLDEKFVLFEEDGAILKLRRYAQELGIPMTVMLREYDWGRVEQAVSWGVEDLLMLPCSQAILQRRVHNMVIRYELEAAGTYDFLTGLYNKETFYNKTSELISKNPGQEYTIFCMNIERFKVVNDLYGGTQGDLLLQFAAEKLRELAEQSGGLAGRLVADIFACCYPCEGNENLSYKEVANVITSALKDSPLDMEIVAALGFYPVQPNSTVPVSIMCDRAMLALVSVKSNYLRNYAVYKEELRENLLSQQEIVNDMEQALEECQFKLFMQPKCDMESGRIVGSEALVRWEHPQKGQVSPGEFITVFEENKFIFELDNYIWEEVCRFIKTRLDHGKECVPISVNVSVVDLYSGSLYDRLVSLVEKYQINPALLELEITESAYAENMHQLIKVVDKLRSFGFTILMDDFGSGYSSLNMLKDINVDILKLDMRFLADNFNGRGRSAEILESIVHMAKWLNLFVIAEGVENQQQRDFLLSIDCHYAQGYLFYKPMPASEFDELLEQEDKVDFRGIHRHIGGLFTLQELISKNPLSDTILQNILGGVAFYRKEGSVLTPVHANEKYFKELNCPQCAICGRSLQVMVCPEDRPLLEKLVEEAAADRASGAEGMLWMKGCKKEKVLLQMKLFYLTEAGGYQIFYSSVRNITNQRTGLAGGLKSDGK